MRPKDEPTVSIRLLPDGRVRAQCGSFTAICRTEERARELAVHLFRTAGRAVTPPCVGISIT